MQPKLFKPIDLMIVGAQKAGTTSLKNYLSEHPEITSHLQTEFSFFANHEEFEQGYERIRQIFFSQKEDEHKIVAKNVGIYNRKYAIERLYQHNPHCLLVFVIRNPVERAFSSFSMQKSNGWTQSLDDLKQAVANYEAGNKNVLYHNFISLGLYTRQLKNIYEYFPKEQVMVILFEDFKKNPLRICQNIFSRLEVDRHFEPDLSKIHNKTTKVKSIRYSRFINWLRRSNNPIKKITKKVVPYTLFTKIGLTLIEANKTKETYQFKQDKEIEEFLKNYFKPYNQELAKITGLDLNHWN